MISACFAFPDEALKNGATGRGSCPSPTLSCCRQTVTTHWTRPCTFSSSQTLCRSLLGLEAIYPIKDVYYGCRYSPGTATTSAGEKGSQATTKAGWRRKQPWAGRWWWRRRRWKRSRVGQAERTSKRLTRRQGIQNSLLDPPPRIPIGRSCDAQGWLCSRERPCKKPNVQS